MPNILAMVRRTLTYWPLIVVTMLLGALITVQVVRMRKPVYKSETVIFYREGIQRSVLGGHDAPTPPENLRNLGAKLKETLLAQTNLVRIIDEFHLYGDVVDKSGYTDAVGLFRRKIDFKARSTDTFAISFEGSTREEAQQVTARLADMLVEENAKMRKERAEETTEFLESEKKRIDDELDKAEKTLAKFLTEHPEFASDNSNRAGASVRAEQKKASAAAEAKRRPLVIVRSPSGEVSYAPQPASLAPPIDPVLAAARNQAMNELIDAKKELADKSLRFTDQHPDVRAAQARVAAAEAALTMADKAIAAVTPRPAPAPAPEKTSDPKDKSAKLPVLGTSAKDKKDDEEKFKPREEKTLVSLETEWARLNREVEKARHQQTQLEGRLFLAQMATSSEVAGYAATIAVLDPAFRPAGPSGTPTRTILLAGFGASLLLGIALAAARGILLDDRIYDPSEVEGLGLCPVLVVIPKVETSKARRGLRG